MPNDVWVISERTSNFMLTVLYCNKNNTCYPINKDRIGSEHIKKKYIFLL